MFFINRNAKFTFESGGLKVYRVQICANRSANMSCGEMFNVGWEDGNTAKSVLSGIPKERN